MNVATLAGIKGATVTPGLGLQLGGGVNFNEHVGVELVYLLNTMSVKSSIGQAVDFKISGLEVRLHYTF